MKTALLILAATVLLAYALVILAALLINAYALFVPLGQRMLRVTQHLECIAWEPLHALKRVGSHVAGIVREVRSK